MCAEKNPVMVKLVGVDRTQYQRPTLLLLDSSKRRLFSVMNVLVTISVAPDGEYQNMIATQCIGLK